MLAASPKEDGFADAASDSSAFSLKSLIYRRHLSSLLGARAAVSCTSVVVFLDVVFGFSFRTPLEGDETRDPWRARTRHWN